MECVCVFQVNLRPPGGQYIHYVAPTTIQVAHPWSRLEDDRKGGFKLPLSPPLA